MIFFFPISLIDPWNFFVSFSVKNFVSFRLKKEELGGEVNEIFSFPALLVLLNLILSVLSQDHTGSFVHV